MSVNNQLCGLVIVILLTIFYHSHRTLKLYKEIAFEHALYLTAVCLILDIVSVFAICFRSQLHPFLVEMICKGYLVSIVATTWSAFVYVLTDVLEDKRHKIYSRGLILLLFIQVILVFSLPIKIYDGVNGVYTYGISVLSVYAFAFIYITCIFVCILVFKQLNPRRSFGVFMWMFLWTASAIFQFINNDKLVIGFAMALGILILFVLMENPDVNLDKMYGCFNSYALKEYINSNIYWGRKFSLFEITFLHVSALEEHGIDVDELIMEILAIAKRYKTIYSFKNINLGLEFVCSDEDVLMMFIEDLRFRIRKGPVFDRETYLILLKDGYKFKDSDELTGCLNYMRTEKVNEYGKVVELGNEIIDEYRERFIISKEIADALEENRVEIFYQPIYSSKDDKVTTAEALARIRTREGEILSPAVFIPVAEDVGSILEIGERVFMKVCEFLKYSRAIELGLHYIEVNLSIVQCEQDNLADRLIEIIERYDVSPEYINLEITETASIRSRQILLKNMKKLIEYGFSFSLDDFGKGESNLMYVISMPVSIVKMDYDLTKAYFKIPRAKHVVKAVIEMCHKMNISMVAEGIETEEENETLLGESIDYIQGYFYSKPMPDDEFLGYLEKMQGE